MKTLSILIALLIFNIGFSQNFPGKNVNLLLNKTVTPKSYDKSDQDFHYKNFFVNFDTTKYLSPFKNNIFQRPNGAYSEYDKLIGKQFIVENIYKEPNIGKSGYQKNSYILKLSNDSIGIVYYKYNTENDFNYELEVVGNLTIPNELYCQDIKNEKDKFTGEVKHFSPIKNGITLTKVVEKDKTSIFMSVIQLGSTASVGEKGVFLLLENGDKISKPDKIINVDANVNSYRYNSTFLLTPSDIKLLKKHMITDKRLYIYDGTVREEAALYIREYLKCLSK